MALLEYLVFRVSCICFCYCSLLFLSLSVACCMLPLSQYSTTVAAAVNNPQGGSEEEQKQLDAVCHVLWCVYQMNDIKLTTRV
jgi:hypothetical protein